MQLTDCKNFSTVVRLNSFKWFSKVLAAKMNLLCVETYFVIHTLCCIRLAVSQDDKFLALKSFIAHEEHSPATQLAASADGAHCKLGVHVTSDTSPSKVAPTGHDRVSLSPIW